MCQCPLQLTHLLQKFAPSVSKGQGSKDEKLLLNIARAINNLAMDLKSQSQLEVGTLKSLKQVFVGMSCALSYEETENYVIVVVQ